MTSIPISFVVLGAVVIALVIVGAVILALLRGSAREPVERPECKRSLAQRYDRAVWAGATVISARHTPAVGSGQGKARVSLRLQVKQQDGRTYQAATTWIVNLANLAQVQPGQSVSIRIDREDPRRIYPNAPWAAFDHHD